MNTMRTFEKEIQPLVTSESDLEIKAVYGPEDVPMAPPPPGEFPFTRGIRPDGYRNHPWTFRQYSGFGTAEESNRRYHLLLERGATGLSVALDLPTQLGYDSDDPSVEEEVGRVGVAIDTLADLLLLFDGIPLDRVSTSFTINSTAAIFLAMYIAAADRLRIPRVSLRGTIQNDILKEYVSRGTWIWPVQPSLRLVGDTIEFCAEEAPKFNALSVAGAHFHDAGATCTQELAFTLQDAIAYCDEVVSRGHMGIDSFAPVISFFFYTHSDFFEEIAKYRAARARWAHIVKERYGAKDQRSCMLRAGVVCGGSTLQAAQPLNNIVRVAYQALASVLGGVQSMFTAAWDEPFALPTEESTTLALQTQQILAYETGVTRTVDPLGGSYFVEALTQAMDEAVCNIMNDIEMHGGMVSAIENGYVQQIIADEAYRRQAAISSGEQVIVGVNRFLIDKPIPDVKCYELDTQARARHLARLAETKRTRSQRAVSKALRDLVDAAKKETNLMPLLIHAVDQYCTIGEIVAALKDVWGEFKEPAVF